MKKALMVDLSHKSSDAEVMENFNISQDIIEDLFEVDLKKFDKKAKVFNFAK
jgi:3-deoxy-D-arabino-heptulosonate 7-phosphate (DAHP) synthase